jgi:hypothetical protein
MSIIANPYTNPESWGAFLVGGSPMPGLLTAMGLPDRQYEYAVQNGFGVGGKVVIYRTTGILESIELTHYIRPNDVAGNGGDWDLWESWMRTMVPGWPTRYKSKPKAYPVTHPATQSLGLARAILKSYGAPFQAIPNDPSYFYKIVFIEWSPQQRIPTGPPEPAKVNGPPVPTDALTSAVLAALAEFKK